VTEQDLSWIKLRRWNREVQGNEYLTIRGTTAEVDEQFLVLAEDGWAPWIWHKGAE
jgi:hypothetical protein